MKRRADMLEDQEASKRYFRKWHKGIAYEVAFWNNLYRWNKGYQEFKGADACCPITLEGFDASAFLSRFASPKVLDVGAGMSYLTGNGYMAPDGFKPMDVDYVDPLAHYYNQIIRRYRRSNPPITFGMVEFLSAYYKHQHVDLIVVQNALDHSFDPIKGIKECLMTLSVGGVLYLNHHCREADKERHKGFHQHNIFTEDGHLIIENAGGRFDVDTILDGVASVSCLTAESGSIVAIITKTAEVPREWVTAAEDISMLTSIVAAPTSLLDALQEKASWLLFNTIQFFVQALSWENRMRLKRLLHI